MHEIVKFKDLNDREKLRREPDYQLFRFKMWCSTISINTNIVAEVVKIPATDLLQILSGTIPIPYDKLARLNEAWRENYNWLITGGEMPWEKHLPARQTTPREGVTETVTPIAPHEPQVYRKERKPHLGSTPPHIRLKARMMKYGIRQKDIAQRTGMSRAYICSALMGHRAEPTVFAAAQSLIEEAKERLRAQMTNTPQ